jgi:hypothetical protein
MNSQEYFCPGASNAALVPAGNTGANDPNLSLVTLAEVRRVEAGYPVQVNSAACAPAGLPSTAIMGCCLRCGLRRAAGTSGNGLCGGQGRQRIQGIPGRERVGMG